MSGKRILIGIYFFTVWFTWSIVSGQTGEAGIESPFSIGVGARALALGNAAVAFPDDPSAFIWNPAGMVVVEQKGIGLSLTTLFEGTQYNFIGYVHPTMSSGTFGVGVARIGTGGIKYTDEVGGVPLDLGELNYWWGRLNFSYAQKIIFGLSAGVNFNVNRQVLGFYSTNGFGVDIGLHYGFPVKGGFLKGLYFGGNFVNVLSPRMKLGISTETIPYHLRVGMAKVFTLRNGADRWLFLADIKQEEHKEYQYHVGSEYSVNGLFFMRVGVNNGSLNFGGGIRYWNFQIDYATSQIADPTFFPRSHRISLVFYIGKSISEQKRLETEVRREEVQARIQERVESDRQKRISEGLQAGKEYLDKQDYFNARLEFTRVLREDEDNQEAQELYAQTEENEKVWQTQHEENLLKNAIEKDKMQRDNSFKNRKLSEGNEYQARGDFRRAIEKWEEALEVDSTNQQIINYIEQAQVELENEVNRLRATAGQLFRRENYSEAYKILNRAKEQAEGNPRLANAVLRDIRTIDNAVDFNSQYQDAQKRYSREDYEGAAEAAENALKLYPNHIGAKELYRNAKARAMEPKQEMGGNVKQFYDRGLTRYIEGQYNEAIQVWEEALKIDPHNVDILKGIESAKKKLETYKKKE